MTKFKREIARISGKLAQKSKDRELSRSNENKAFFAAMSDQELDSWGRVADHPTPMPPGWESLSEQQALVAFSLFLTGIPLKDAIQQAFRGSRQSYDYPNFYDSP